MESEYSKQVNPDHIVRFQGRVLHFSECSGRGYLPWRKTRDPWKVLLAEILLRKTTSDQALSVFGQLGSLSPKQIQKLGQDKLESILLPIGMYRVRAQQMLAIAETVEDAGIESLHSQSFLDSLPGVGRYIRNAVLCVAFGEARPMLDTNMIRVICRVFGIESKRSRAREDRQLWNFAETLVPVNSCREFNWGILDLASAVCKPRNPHCLECVVSQLCNFCREKGIILEDSVEKNNKDNNITIASLFAGAGGFDWGFHLTGRYVTHFANELKVAPSKTFAHNLGLHVVQSAESQDLHQEHSLLQGDISDVSFAKLDGFEPDVMIGGPPCQDFSLVKANQRKGIEVKRGKLYSHFVRGLLALQPKAFVFENVPGLLSANSGNAYKAILDDFANLSLRWKEISQITQSDNGIESDRILGYHILFSRIVDAQKLGVPQTRRRLFIIGLRQDLANKVGIFTLEKLHEHIESKLSGTDTLAEKYPLTCMEVFEGCPLSELQPKYREVMEEYQNVWTDVSTPYAVKWKRNVWDSLTLDVIQDYLLLNKIDPKDSFEFTRAMEDHSEILLELGYLNRPLEGMSFNDSSNRLASESESVLERMRRIPPGQNHEFVRGTPWAVEGRGISLIYRRPFPLKPAPTVVAFGGGGTWGYHYAQERGKLTNRERARIQTFTDDFEFLGSNTEVRAQIGEAVPPRLAQKIAETLDDVLSSVE